MYIKFDFQLKSSRDVVWRTILIPPPRIPVVKDTSLAPSYNRFLHNVQYGEHHVENWGVPGLFVSDLWEC